MNVLSLFDGMSCGRIALDRAGVEVENYYASELDKHAIKVTQANWPKTIQLGDVENWRDWDIQWRSIDLLIGGSPCQGFSFAGKQLAFDDPRSKLFFVYLDILNHIRAVNPRVHFMLENVKMKKEYLDVISEKLGVEPVFINSALVSAQNRQRYYWANWEFVQPDDKGLILSDILEKESDNFVFMSEKFVNRQKERKCLRDDFTGKAASLSAMEYVKNGRQGDYVLSMTPRGNNKGGDRATDGKTPSLTSNSWQDNFHLTNDHKSYRKLTPVECERLQTVPDNYTNHVSNSQRYKMLGNGWTVDVITHIFKHLPIYL
jgi:DNA-cytosine methyltransferase